MRLRLGRYSFLSLLLLGGLLIPTPARAASIIIDDQASQQIISWSGFVSGQVEVNGALQDGSGTATIAPDMLLEFYGVSSDFFHLPGQGGSVNFMDPGSIPQIGGSYDGTVSDTFTLLYTSFNSVFLQFKSLTEAEEFQGSGFLLETGDFQDIGAYLPLPTGLSISARSDITEDIGPAPVPEPSSLLLLGTGLIAGVRRWRKRAPSA